MSPTTFLFRLTLFFCPISNSEPYMIFVDNRPALRAIASVWCKSRFVRESKESLRTFGLDRIRLCWIPGHRGILGKETADALVVGSDPPICHLYGLIHGWIKGKEQTHWGKGSGYCVSDVYSPYRRYGNRLAAWLGYRLYHWALQD